jgi:hypothetical protein
MRVHRLRPALCNMSTYSKLGINQRSGMRSKMNTSDNDRGPRDVKSRVTPPVWRGGQCAPDECTAFSKAMTSPNVVCGSSPCSEIFYSTTASYAIRSVRSCRPFTIFPFPSFPLDFSYPYFSSRSPLQRRPVRSVGQSLESSIAACFD